MKWFFDMFQKSVLSSTMRYQSVFKAATSRIKNVSKKISTYIRKTIQKTISFIMGKPSAKKDYQLFQDLYVSKRFILQIAIVCVLLAVLLVKVVYPFLEGRLWPATLTVNTPKYHTFTGKAKVYDQEDALLYKGKLLDGMADGDGQIYQFGKPVYSGAMKENLYNGQGTLYDKEGKILYQGGFQNNLYEGDGMLYYANGEIEFSGTFSMGKYMEGVAYYPNGRKKYSGQFVDGLYSGTATLFQNIEKNGVLYEGNFANGVFDGEGRRYQGKNLLYAGGFSNGLYHGSGSLYKDGLLLYEGGFQRGKMSGEGIKYSLETNKVVYQGNFNDDLYNQEGKLYDENIGRMIYEGNFLNGMFSGTGDLYSQGGRKLYSGLFNENEIDYMQFVKSDLDAIRQAFGTEDELTMLPNSLLLSYKDLGVVYEADFAEDMKSPSVHQIKFYKNQKINGVDRSLTLKKLKEKLKKDSYTEYIFQVSDGELAMLLLCEADMVQELYCVKYLFEDYYIRAYSANENGKIIYYELGAAQ